MELDASLQPPTMREHIMSLTISKLRLAMTVKTSAIGLSRAFYTRGSMDSSSAA